jgi:bis(5'-nucleosyl)-tetraphosphatase (symmetrical)
MHPGRASRDLRIVFGHWSTLGYYDGHGVYALDTGCWWGGALTALRLEDAKIFQIRCPQSVDPMGVD